MKLLVCIIGTLRGGHIPSETLNRYILKPYKASLLLCITHQESNKSHPMTELAKYVLEHPHQNSMEAAFDSAMNTKWSHKNLQRTVWNHANMIYYRWRLKEDLIKNNLLHYDYYIVTRSDNVYINSNFPFVENQISIPIGQNFRGLCDRFMIVHRSNIVDSLSMIEFIYETRILKSHIEKMLCFFFENKGFHVGRFLKNHFIIMRPNEQSGTTNRLGVFLNFEHKVKYTGEYADCFMDYRDDIIKLENEYRFSPKFTLADFRDAEDRKRDAFTLLLGR